MPNFIFLSLDEPERWTLEKGRLWQLELDVVVDNSNTLEMCGVSEPDNLPRGKYCLHKVKTVERCPHPFIQGLFAFIPFSNDIRLQ